MSEETILTDAYGEVTQAQWRLYKKANVSPADHDELLEVFGDTPAARKDIMAAVRRHTVDGMYSSYRMIEENR